MSNEIKLREVLEVELKFRNETVTSISKKLGIPNSTLASWSSGVVPSGKNLHHLKTLSKYFGLSLDHLLFGEGHNISQAKTLFSSTFVDEDKTYKLTIQKVTN